MGIFGALTMLHALTVPELYSYFEIYCFQLYIFNNCIKIDSFSDAIPGNVTLTSNSARQRPHQQGHTTDNSLPSDWTIS